MKRGFYGWGFMEIMRAYEQAMREGLVLTRTTHVHDDSILITGVDVGAPDGDRTAVAALRGKNRLEVIIIDDPYQEAHTYEGEFHEINEIAKALAHEKLPAAQDTTPNRGPKPRTKYPRRR
jgi:hypothetical protein